MRSSVGCLGLVFAVASCGAPGSVETVGRIAGRLIDAETEDPLEGARVSTMPSTDVVRTDAEGRFALEARLGTRYQVRAELEGYTAQSQPFTPQVGAPRSVDFALELLQVCVPGQRRCVAGDTSAGVEVCSGRGNLWERERCTAEQACDPEAFECSNLAELTVELVQPGGVVRSRPLDGQPDRAINCGTDCARRFFEGSEVTLVATPLARSRFVEWGGSSCAGSNPVCTFVLTQDSTVEASFSADAFGVTVINMGDGGGAVVSTPAGVDCGDVCSAVFAKDAEVVLLASPDAASDFDAWRGDCAAFGTSTTCVLRLDSNKSVEARFVPKGVALEVSRSGTGAGSIRSDPGGVDCGAQCAATYRVGTLVTLTASAAAGSTFTGWSGDCAGRAPRCEVDMSAPRTVGASFEGLSRPMVVEVMGEGRVTSTPAGIDCAPTCGGDFAAGAVVELAAGPRLGAVFDGWGLDCASAGLSATCSLSMDASRRARAAFVPVYLRPLREDAACTFRLPLDAGAPAAVLCGGSAGTASVVGGYSPIASRRGAFAEALVANGPDEQGYIDVARALPTSPTATVELTIRRDGPAFATRGRAALVSDMDMADAMRRGLHLQLLDDGRLTVSTRDGAGGTSTASSAVATIGNGTWYHVAATVDPVQGLGLFVDGVEVARTVGPVAWTASSSTAWVGAERGGPGGGSIHRFNGAVDEVRVSDVVRY